MKCDQITVCGNIYVDKGSHIIFIYNSKEELLELFSEYFFHGINSNDDCIMISKQDLSQDLKNRIIEKNIKNPKSLQKNLEFVNSDDLYFKNKVFDKNKVFKIVDKKVNNSSFLRSASDCSWVGDDLINSFHEYEEEVTKKYGSKKILLLCAYDSKKISLEKLTGIIRAHKTIIFKQGSEWKLCSSDKIFS